VEGVCVKLDAVFDCCNSACSDYEVVVSINVTIWKGKLMDHLPAENDNTQMFHIIGKWAC
jgi:hypothetical protein